MTKTIKSVIGDFNVQKLTQKNKEYHEIGTPRLFIDITKKAIEQYKAGEFKVGGMAKKYPVENTHVKSCWIAPAITYNWALPAKGDEVDTEILYLQTENDGYYYDYFNNTIGASLKELNLKDNSIGEFKSFVLSGEVDEPTQYYQVYYTIGNSPVLSTVVTSYIDSTDAAARFVHSVVNASVQKVINLTKSQAVVMGLNF